MLGIGLSLPVTALRRGGIVGDPTLSLDLDFTAGALDSRIAVTRAGTATRVNSAGLVEVVAANTARVDHDPVSLARRGLLIEEARTNLALHSAALGHSVWEVMVVTKGASSIPAPDGTMTATTLTINDGMHIHMQTIGVSPSTVYTFSFYAHRGTATDLKHSIFDDTNQADITPLTSYYAQTSASAWRRITVTFTTPGTCTAVKVCTIRDGGAVGTVHLWGAQLEAGAFATSYIPTVTATAARAVDQVTVPVGDWFDPATGTLFADFTPLGVGTGLQTVIYLDDGTAAERMGIRASSSANAMLVVDGNAVQAQNTIGTLTTAATRVAMAYAANDFAGVQNGGTVQTDTAGALPTVTRLLIGTRLAGSEALNAHFRRARFYKTRRPNAELQTLTA